jgi:hypothetical protein
MAKESRRRQPTPAQDVLGNIVSHAKRPARHSRDQATDLAESFRKASLALEAATRDFVAFRHRVTKHPRA